MNPSPALSVTIAEVLVGRAEPFGPSSFSSAIRKRPVTESINLASVGFAGDEQADRRYHGGPDKAVHHYPFEHYAMWCRERPVLALQLRVGAFGENLSTRGMSEENVCVGDIFRAGSALLQVSQARQPCWKLNVRFGLNDMARLVQASGRTGWYYRVLEEGRVGRGDRLVLLERPNPAWPLRRVLRYFYVDTRDRDTLVEIAALRDLTTSWREIAKWRLENARVENWDRRLRTPGSEEKP